jgi:hypothetical protein
MAARRKDDEPISRTRFRTDRMVQDGGHWFFLTREGSTEGPFTSLADAVEQLGIYITLALNEMLPQRTGVELKLDSLEQTRAREAANPSFQCWSRNGVRKSA